jgi:transglutaminase-like putative cysteine protease
MLFKLLRILSIILFLTAFNISSVFAQSTNFTTEYNVVYTVQDDGLTKADLNITLTNTTAEFYAESYQMKLGFSDIRDLVASDSSGRLKSDLKKGTDGYDLSVTLNKKSLGIGRSNSFKISFLTSSVLRDSGNIKEVTIPGIADPSQFKNFSVEVKTPESFGRATFIKPVKEQEKLIFTKEDLGKSGISIGFGEKQNFDFGLTYHLKNSNLFPVKTEIALPPDTNYQKVYITKINPKPNIVRIDRDGNWLAEYSLKPGQNIDVSVEGIAEIKLNPKSSTLSTSDKSEYTKPTKYWQSNSPEIKKLADDLKTPEAIYEYVTKTLKYDFSRVSKNQHRLGALGTLKKTDSAVCREFTDLFIAISRAAGIPAREVNGFAYTNNSRQRPLSLVEDVLHAWPEYYDTDKKSWIMVDPTWGATTGGIDYFNILDFDHFAFIIKGIDDSTPIPAGGYKTTEKANSKDVEIKLSKANPDFKPNFKINLNQKDAYVGGLPISINAIIENLGPGSISGPFQVSSNDLFPRDQVTGNLYIPPFGKNSVNIKFDNTSVLTNKESLITMRFEDNKTERKVKIVPFFLNIYIIGGITIGIFTLIILAAAGKSRSLRIFR